MWAFQQWMTQQWLRFLVKRHLILKIIICGWQRRMVEQTSLLCHYFYNLCSFYNSHQYVEILINNTFIWTHFFWCRGNRFSIEKALFRWKISKTSVSKHLVNKFLKISDCNCNSLFFCKKCRRNYWFSDFNLHKKT